MPKVAILGASGRLGDRLVARGQEVRCADLARSVIELLGTQDHVGAELTVGST